MKINRPSPVTVFTMEQSMFWVYFRVLSRPDTWLCFLLTSVLALAPDLCLKVIENMMLGRLGHNKNYQCFSLELNLNVSQKKSMVVVAKLSIELTVMLVILISRFFWCYWVKGIKISPVYFYYSKE